MGLLVPNNTETTKSKVFNGVRRTQEGMLYLTTINPNSDSADIQFSNYFEPGKSDLVPKDETDYTEERLELFNVQYFTGDNSTTTFTLNATGITAENLAVYIGDTRQVAYEDYTISGTTLTFVRRPANSAVITTGQLVKRYKNNDSDKYQQFKWNSNQTVTFLINSSGDLVRRVNNTTTRTITADDFDSFEDSTASVNTTTYQSAI